MMWRYIKCITYEYSVSIRTAKIVQHQLASAVEPVQASSSDLWFVTGTSFHKTRYLDTCTWLSRSMAMIYGFVDLYNIPSPGWSGQTNDISNMFRSTLYTASCSMTSPNHNKRARPVLLVCWDARGFLSAERNGWNEAAVYNRPRP